MTARSASGEHRLVGEASAEAPRAYSGFDHLLEGCQVIDRAWRYLYVNDALVAQARRSRDELLGRTMMEAYPGIERAPFFAKLRDCMEHRRPHRLENEFEFQDGLRVWFELRVEPVPEGVLVLSIDVDDRKRADQRFRVLVESAPHGIFVQTRGRFVYLNAAACRLFGVADAAELIGEPVLDAFAPGDRERVRERIRRLNEERSPVEAVEESIVRRDGERLALEVSAVPIEYGGANGALVFAVDLSERRRAEAERAKLEAQFRQAQKMEAIGRLAGGVAHDFNNLLSVILGYADLAAARAAGDERLRGELAEIRRAGESAAALTRQLLAFSRQQVLRPVVLDVNEVVRGLEPMLARLLGEDVDLQLRLAPELGRVEADPHQIEQVVMNLAVNARDAMPGGGQLTIETADVELDEAYAASHVGVATGPHVVLAVRDDGVGMDAETRERLFEPFFTTKEAGKGTGLGLATVYGIVRQSGGNVWVYSEPGMGTIFRVYLPRAAEGAAPAAASSGAAPPRGGDETVLLVEDREPLRQLLARTLAGAGYTVLAATNGNDALRVCDEHAGAVHLVLTDVVMPEMGGLELVARLRDRHPGLRVLFMSGYSEEAVARHEGIDPARNFLGKPFSVAELQRRVRDLLDG
jgi:two-component system cell cycle sensor histidine kinase/response regulator CckA